MTTGLVVSIVSHGHGALLKGLLEDIARLGSSNCRVTLTLNIPEQLPFDPAGCGVPVQVSRNNAARGFGANHNAAFRRDRGDHFCVLNPDIRLPQDPFPALLDLLQDASVGVAAPQIRSPGGDIEDSARRFPTPASILAKAAGIGAKVDYAQVADTLRPDWVAGMFMLFRSGVFERVGGFDERYFLYYEDVDLCARLGRLGLTPALSTRVFAIHDARRESHRNLRYMARHLSSMRRFFVSRW
jgi:N-acetylglucosaminyl-diphospho-decaprenol L-rhamnosyltransferase